ncbi:PREDICTED: uncharacterized protein LOC109192674 [Ipomoea nil]|uniref:uncharacterized protein LOC109192674 n=1 Tax=Ipomoea nil TaxID=35883 RepID=UPI0009015AEF|nr:PREDICTED: uncharacterized protein LOC109192674 [Ipomoea nil]
MEERMSKLEALVMEQGSGLTEVRQSVEDNAQQLRSDIQSWKAEIMELLRLNRPPPPSGGTPSVHGQVPSHQNSLGESSVDPGRRQGKEPAMEDPAELQEISEDEEGHGENQFAQNVDPKRAGRPGMPRRVHFEARPGGDPLLRYKQEFPMFDYENPRLWVIRCERFLMLARIPRDEVLNILCINLSGKVGVWFEGYLNGLRVGFQWVEFARAVCKRFSEHNVDVMEEFSNFKQWGSIINFADKYEEYKGLLLQNYPYLTDQYFLHCFVVRLKQQLRCFVRTTKSTSLEDAIWVARQFEKGLKVSEPQKNPFHFTKKPSYSTQRTQTNPRTLNQKNSEPSRSQNSQNSLKTTASYTPQPNTQSPEISRFRDQLRQQNRCFRCFEAWAPGHRCKSPTFNIIEGTGVQETVKDFNEVTEVEKETLLTPEEEVVEVTLNAVIGGEGINTLKFGSTHCFVDPRVLEKIGIVPTKTETLNVTVANGEKLICDSVCKGLGWQVQKESFKKDLRVLKLGGCDIVLGMDWINTYAPIQLHTRTPGISLCKEGKKVWLKGLTRSIVLQQASKKEVRRWKKGGVQGYLLQGSLLEISSSGLAEPNLLELNSLLLEFQDLFEEPKTLPPPRPFDHEIPLIPRAKPINAKPYRYSYLQKNTMEKMVDEMLTAGLISPSTSPFASPVLLVPKKENSWRFCVDYRALNDITIKNKFPIPLIEDLFSELAHAKVFTKLDLRAGYHQVRMKLGEEYKTTFRTHQGLYEFKVMPFGLTNAPTTFQALMNHVFQPLIWKTVLVFFDDILVYSPSMENH